MVWRPSSGAASAQAADITGAGATFIYPILSKWSDSYNNATGNKINYQSIGSGGGITQIKAGTVSFGSSDKPLTPQELDDAGLAQFPSVIGGVVPVINVEGIDAGKLKFTGPLLADIYQGKIKKWNDPAIAQVNPGVTLADANITVVHRSDGSGTTFNFTNYLSKVSPDWKSKAGEGTTVSWPVGVGGKGNEGVAAYVKQIKGSIGYVELAYALQNKMTYTALQNSAGQFVQPSLRRLPGRRRQRRLEERAGLQSRHHQRAGRELLADHRDQLHPGLQAAEGFGRGQVGARLLQVGLRERRQAGRGTGLRAAAHVPGRADRSLLAGPDQALSVN